MAKIKRNPAALKIADLIFENYDLKNANDANDALKEVFGPLKISVQYSLSLNLSFTPCAAVQH